MYGIVGLLILVLDIYTILQVIKGGGEPVKQLLWILVILILPLVGPLLYFILGSAKV
jgi:hypothetical protein